MNHSNSQEDGNVVDLARRRQEFEKAKRAAEAKKKMNGAKGPRTWRHNKGWYVAQSLIYVIVLILVYRSCQPT